MKESGLEILAPAGNFDCAMAAIHSGADAIYLGLSSFSARANAENFNDSSLENIILKAHCLDVKVYVAMNTLIKDNELNDFFKELISVWNLGIDAIIMQDIYLGKIVHEKYPQIVLHLSTQAGICNTYGAKYAKECGFSRVILARETPLKEIEKITQIIETEVFVQGALCTAYSGQCYFSSFAGGNSGNRGKCKQPCRKKYFYDRKGYDQKAYALSLSDLCVGEDIERLKAAGVLSFKIEGRMRRAEYVSAAVGYYRLLLDGESSQIRKGQALSDLRKTYNRGNYTRGLTFSQDKRFLSRAVQGHLGEKVGVVKVENGQFNVESTYIPQMGDAFKILRNGSEVGGAVFAKTTKRGFQISSKIRLMNGDSVFITTSKEVNERLLGKEKRKKILLKRVCFAENQKAFVECNGQTFYSEFVCESATSRPLSKEDVQACFLKVGELPFTIEIEELTVGNVFIPKSLLNSFRREIYERLVNVTFGREKLLEEEIIFDNALNGSNQKTAVVASSFSWTEKVAPSIAIWKPYDYTLEPDKHFLSGVFEKYVYMPPLTTEKDLERIQQLIKQYNLDGVYSENYSAISFARENKFFVFAGTGFNLTNKLSVQKLLEEKCVQYYAVSKELDEKEQAELDSAKGFTLTSGNLKLMDLCYCPFEKTCKSCDRKSIYSLTDENNRVFPVRRYVNASGECRFEVYNCAELIGKSSSGQLLDCSILNEEQTEIAVMAKDNEEKQKLLYKSYTSGHRRKSVL